MIDNVLKNWKQNLDCSLISYWVIIHAALCFSNR